MDRAPAWSQKPSAWAIDYSGETDPAFPDQASHPIVMRLFGCAGFAVALASSALVSGCGLVGGPDDPGPQVPIQVVETTPEGLTILARSPAEPLLLESVAFDAEGRLLVASIRRAGVFRLDMDGTLTRFTREGDTHGVFGMVADRARGDLWITTSNTIYDTIEGDGGSALLRLELETGRVEAAYAMPDAQLSDLALGPDGTVFVSDTAGGGIYRLDPGSNRLERLVDAPDRASPQGLVVSEDGRWLIFANYGTGLHRVVVDTGAIQAVRVPEGVEARGLDGLSLYGNRIIAIQNGTQTQRVLALRLSPDWTSVTERTALFEGAPLSEPTTGFVAGDNFVFIARSQWTDFGQDGAPETQAPAPAIVARIALNEALP